MTIQILMRVIRAAMVPERKAPPKRGQGLSWKENQDEATATDTAWVGGLELRNAQRKKSCSPKSVVDFTDFGESGTGPGGNIAFPARPAQAAARVRRGRYL